MRAAVLGAGVAGLSAAWRLLQLKPDWEVVVLEQEKRPGGLAVTWSTAGMKADLGPHRIYTELPEIQALLPDLIAQEEMLTVPRHSQLLLGGHFYRYPVRATELLRVMGPFTTAKLAMSAVLGKFSGTANATNYEEAMIGSFGHGVYDMIIKPYTRKVWKIDPARLSAEVARVRVSAGSMGKLAKQILYRGSRKAAPTALSSLTYIRGGVEGLVRSLEKRVIDAGGQIELASRVTGFSGGQGRVTEVMWRSGQTSQQSAFDCFISTVPVTDLIPMLRPIRADHAASEAAGGLVYVGLVLIAFVINRPRFSKNNWLYFPEQDYVFNRGYEPANFDPDMAMRDKTLIVLEVTDTWDGELWKRSDPEIVEMTRRDLLKTGLVKQEEIIDASALRVPYTYPLYTVDYRQRLDNVFSYLRNFENLVSTGRQGLFNHNNMDHSMLVGLRAADYTAADEKPAARWYDELDQFSHFRIVD